MKCLTSLNIGTRMGLGFLLVLVCNAALLATGLWCMQRQNAGSDAIMAGAGSQAASLEMRETGSAIALSLRKLAAPTDDSESLVAQRKIEQLQEQYQLAKGAFRRHATQADALILMRNVEREEQAINAAIAQVRRHASDGNFFEAARLAKEQFEPHHVGWSNSLIALADAQRRGMDAVHEAARTDYGATRIVLLIAGVATTLAGVAVSFFITRSIIVPLRAATQAAQTISVGDLAADIAVHGSDEIALLQIALRKMRDNIRDMVERIERSAAEVLAASQAIAAASLELSSRTEAQAGTLEQTTAAADEIASNVRNNASRVSGAHDVAAAAASGAVGGGVAVARVVQTMAAISASSARIVDIIAMIDGIAFQTNILALNAAVEAARAGEHGRGFAVVATEVRALAQRTASAASEVGQLIRNAVVTVKEGDLQAKSAGTAMDDIVCRIQRVVELMNEIDATSKAQSDGVQEIGAALASIDDMTQQNAAMVEQATADADSLRMEAGRLHQSVAQFKLAAPSVSDAAPPDRRLQWDPIA